MSPIQVTALKCPNCACPISDYNGRHSIVKCKDCGHVLVITGEIAASTEPPERIIPFTTSEQDFESMMEDVLLNTADCPPDIFDAIELDRVRPLYLPMYLYTGSYEGDWYGELGQEDIYIGTNELGRLVEKKRIEWSFTQGTVRGDFAALTLAYRGALVPPQLLTFAKNYPVSHADACEFEDHYLTQFDNIQAVQNTEDKEASWLEYGYKQMLEQANEKIYRMLRQQESRGIKGEIRIEENPSPSIIYFPFWYVRFQYKSKSYFFIMDGQGKKLQHLLPKDKTQGLQQEQLNRNMNRATWTFFIAEALAMFSPSLLCWGILAVTILLVYLYYIEEKRKAVAKLKKHAQKRREAGFNRLSAKY